MEGREEAAGGEHEGSLRQESPSVVHPVQISSGHVSHADCSGRTVQELVTIPAAARYVLLDLIFHFAGATSLFDIFNADRVVIKEKTVTSYSCTEW